MRLVCARPHYWTPPVGTVTCDGIGAWLFHTVLCHANALRLIWLREWLIRTGFIDNEAQGARLFWRWDRSNARLAASLRRIEREEWLRKRAATIARWGEGAG